MLEKAELTLINMLSKTKKVFTTPPPVLCSIASYKIFYSTEKKFKIFHYYLCRQLKGGGMEISMTEYIIGNWNDKAEIIDFLNYVFSQLRVPHDFKRLMPVLYADDVLDFETPHYLVKRDGKILANVMNHTSCYKECAVKLTV